MVELEERDICPGTAHSGKPCGQPAGFGTDHLGKGVCLWHTPEKMAELDDPKKQFLDVYGNEPISIVGAALRAGVDQSTVFRWRYQDPEFDAACVIAKAKSLRHRLTIVEDSMFNRIQDGDASATEIVFWMTNIARQLGSTEWLHVQQVVHGADKSLMEVAQAWTSAVKKLAAEEEDDIPEADWEHESEPKDTTDE